MSNAVRIKYFNDFFRIILKLLFFWQNTLTRVPLKCQTDRVFGLYYRKDDVPM